LSTAFSVDVTNAQQKQQLSIKPQTIDQIFGLGLNSKEALEVALEKLVKKKKNNNNNSNNDNDDEDDDEK